VTGTNLGQRNIVEVRGESAPEISMADPNDLLNLFANMLSAIKVSSREMQESNDKLRISVEDSNKALQNNVAASNAKLQESVRADIKSEMEKLIKRFELENQRLKQGIFGKAAFGSQEMHKFNRSGAKGHLSRASRR
jgi:metal-dependent amidase/aminoacylase/carboxypeptidase family protein